MVHNCAVWEASSVVRRCVAACSPSVERTNILRGQRMVQLKGQHRKGMGQVRGLSSVKLSPLYLSCRLSCCMSVMVQRSRKMKFQGSKAGGAIGLGAYGVNLGPAQPVLTFDAACPALHDSAGQFFAKRVAPQRHVCTVGLCPGIVWQGASLR